MVRGKVAGVMFGGLAGYLLLSRAMSLIENSISRICETSKWKAYYKHGSDNTVPPGYRSVTRKIDDEHEYAIEDPNEIGPDGKDIQKDTHQESPGVAVVNAINKAANEWLDKADERREAKKREREASEGGDTDGDNVLWMDVNKSTAGEDVSEVLDSLENGVEVVASEEDISDETLD